MCVGGWGCLSDPHIHGPWWHAGTADCATGQLQCMCGKHPLCLRVCVCVGRGYVWGGGERGVSVIATPSPSMVSCWNT